MKLEILAGHAGGCKGAPGTPRVGQTPSGRLLSKTRRSGEQTLMIVFSGFWKDERGQDLIEYTLLLGFVALASAALFVKSSGSIKGIWSTSSSQLSYANTLAS